MAEIRKGDELLAKGVSHVGGHVTLLFSIHSDDERLEWQGSRGAGFSLNKGVKVNLIAVQGKGHVNLDVTGFTGNFEIQTNGYISNLQHSLPPLHLSLLVLDQLKRFGLLTEEFDWDIQMDLQLPTQHGFGLSASASLALALSVQQAISPEVDEDIRRQRAYHVAHYCERITSGGLGDLAGMIGGGVEVRRTAGLPPLKLLGKEGERFPGIVDSHLYKHPLLLIWDPNASLDTPTFIDNPEWMRKITRSGERAMVKLADVDWDGSDIAPLMDFSEEFLIDSELSRLPELQAIRVKVESTLANHFQGVRLAHCLLGVAMAIFFPNDVNKNDIEDLQKELIEVGLESKMVKIPSDPVLTTK